MNEWMERKKSTKLILVVEVLSGVHLGISSQVNFIFYDFSPHTKIIKFKLNLDKTHQRDIIYRQSPFM